MNFFFPFSILRVVYKTKKKQKNKYGTMLNNIFLVLFSWENTNDKLTVRIVIINGMNSLNETKQF